MSFLTLLPGSHARVSGLDDAVFVTASRGVFYLAETGSDEILAITVNDLEPGSLFASVGSLSALVKVNLKTGLVSTFVPNLNGPHGLIFRPAPDDGEGDR